MTAIDKHFDARFNLVDYCTLICVQLSLAAQEPFSKNGSQNMATLFLSYRRSDCPDTVKLIYERLKSGLRNWEIFYDHRSIAPGEPFPERLRKEIGNARVVLVAIGPNWLQSLRQRKGDAIDHVREEIRLALQAGNTVIPVAVGQAVLPTTADLADFPELLPLVARNARKVRPDPDFDSDIERLITELLQHAPLDIVGSVIAGKYKVIRVIGEGGMGIVYAAEQLQPKRTVALKLIKPGMDTKDVLARFDAERQALAVMEHPNIAKVIDAGSAVAGRPFFVMEYVKGVHITEYCDDKKLTPSERLNLFRVVCDAVQHAHQKGIIHRDIKPSNVLVEVIDGKASAKVIDFGLAKALGFRLTDKTLLSEQGKTVGTLLYSSPEQAAGRVFEVDTRSDIYSLGVLLYELLVGEPPFSQAELQEAGEEEMKRIIRESDPARPSTKLSSSNALPTIAANRRLDPAKLMRQVRGDLDSIVMKTLEKEPARRYSSASDLAEDLGRFLVGESVQARPPTSFDRAVKWIRRKPQVAAVYGLTLLAAVLVAITGGFALLWQDSRAARVRAETSENDAKEAKQREVAAQVKEREATQGKLNAEQKTRETAQDLIGEFQYIEAIRRVKQFLNARNQDEAEFELQATEPGRRRWEWYFLRNLIARRPSMEVPCELGSVVFSPRGNLCAGLNEQEIWVYNPATRVRRKVQFGRTPFNKGLAFSADGQTIAAGSGSDVQLFSAPSLEKSSTLSTEEGFPIGDVAYSPDGKWLTVSDTLGYVTIWDTASLKVMGKARSGQDAKLRFLADRQVLAIVCDKSFDLVELPSGKKIKTNEKDKQPIFADSPPRGRFVVQYGKLGDETVIKVCEADTGKECFRFKNGSRPVISADDTLFASQVSKLSDNERRDAVVVRELPGGRVLFELPVSELEGIAFSPDGRVLACYEGRGWQDDRGLSLWDIATRKPLMGFAPREPKDTKPETPEGVGIPTPLPIEANVFRFSADGRWVVRGWPSRLVWWFVGEPLPCRELIQPKAVTSLAVTGDDTLLAIVTNEFRREIVAEVRLWDLTTGKERGLLTGHKGRVAALAFSADGSTLTSISHVFTFLNGGKPLVQMRYWDVPNQKERPPVKDFVEQAFSLACSPDGQQLALGIANPIREQSEVRVLDLSGDREAIILPIEKGVLDFVNAVVYSPNGKRLAASSCERDGNESRGMIKSWLVANPKEQKTLHGHVGQITALAFAPDGDSLVSGGEDCKVKFWDLTFNNEIATFVGHERAVRAAAFSPKEKLAASCGDDGTVRLWDLSTKGERATLRAPTGEFLVSLGFSPDGSAIAAGGVEGSITLWNTHTYQQIAHLIGHTSSVQSLAFSFDGKMLASGSGRMTQARDGRNGHFSGTLTLRDLSDGTVQSRRTIASEGINVIAAASNGRLLAYGTGDVWWQTGHIRLLDLNAHTENYLRGHNDSVQSLAFSNDGRTLVSGSADQKVIVWDTASRQKKSILDQESPGTAVAISPDGKFVASWNWESGDHVKAHVIVSDATTGKKLRTFAGQKGPIHALAFSIDGELVACACDDQAIRLWNVISPKEERVLKGHAGAVSSLAFFPDGKTLASGNAGRTVTLWDIITGLERMTLTEPTGPVITVRVCDLGRSLVAADEKGSIWIWNGLWGP